MHIPEGAKKTAGDIFKTAFFETLTSAAGSFISSFFEPLKEKAGAAGYAVGHEVAKAFAESRDEMFGWIHDEFRQETTSDQNGESKAHENFNRRWKFRQLHAHKPYAGKMCVNFSFDLDLKIGMCDNGTQCPWSYKPGDEVAFTGVWTGVYVHLGGKEEYEKRINTFQYYFELDSDEEFDVVMQQLVHDLVKQYGEKFYEFFKVGFRYLQGGWASLEDGPFLRIRNIAEEMRGIPITPPPDPSAGQVTAQAAPVKPGRRENIVRTVNVQTSWTNMPFWAVWLVILFIVSMTVILS